MLHYVCVVHSEDVDVAPLRSFEMKRSMVEEELFFMGESVASG